VVDEQATTREHVLTQTLTGRCEQATFGFANEVVH